jgi:O-acetyl-ADP-ribose deacetylase (regulator of RNase III)
MSGDNRCFVIMPYGVKQDLNGKSTNFDTVYKRIIREAVERVPGLVCVRCDDDQKPGWIASRMLNDIFSARAAIVDTSTLNPNVFYELGVRHALRRSVTVLIRKKATPSPFNIQGLRSIEYDTGPRAAETAITDIAAALTEALEAPSNVDSLVYEVLDDLAPPLRLPRPITRFQEFRFPLNGRPGAELALVTGDREDLSGADVWVSSENTDMQMDAYYGKSTSATIRYLGAEKDAVGRVVKDTIGDELGAQTGNISVPPTTVVVTGSGALIGIGVKQIYHVAAVRGEPRSGYRPVAQLDRCVKNALRQARGTDHRAMLFPIFGTGPGGGDLREHAEICFRAAAEYLAANPAHPVTKASFYVWTDVDLEICREVMQTTVDTV